MADLITIKRETVQQALDALENSSTIVYQDIEKSHLREATITALRTALEAPAAQKVEPYCWLYKDDMGECRLFFGTPPEYSLPLYRHPASAAQEPLTDEKIKAIAFNTRYRGIIDTRIRAIEAAHGIGTQEQKHD